MSVPAVEMRPESYRDTGSVYFAHTRRDVMRVIPPELNGSVLEIGCGRGHTLMALKQNGRARRTVGVELVEMARTEAEVAGVDRYVVGNIETETLDLGDEPYDVVICADVLEHLRDPWQVVAALTARLRPGGMFVASVPNVREVRTMVNVLLRGDFAYADAGVLDRTHLRFFCKRNILDLVAAGGAVVETVSHDIATRHNWRANLNRWTFGVLEEFLVTQYIVAARRR